MVKNRNPLTKVIGAALILLTLASTVVVVVESCHAGRAPAVVAATSHAAHTDHHHPAPTPLQSTNHSELFTQICAGVFYLVLLLGGKFLLRIFRKSYKNQIQRLTAPLIAFNQRVSNNLTLSLPQLGICRI